MEEQKLLEDEIKEAKEASLNAKESPLKNKNSLIDYMNSDALNSTVGLQQTKKKPSYKHGSSEEGRLR